MLKSKTKETVVWFIDTSGLPKFGENAKLQQISDWLDKEKPFGAKYNTIIVPAKENKFCLLKSEEEFVEEFSGDSQEWLDAVKDKLRDCLTIYLDIQTNNDQQMEGTS